MLLVWFPLFIEMPLPLKLSKKKVVRISGNFGLE